MFTIRYLNEGREEIWQARSIICNHPPQTESGLIEVWCPSDGDGPAVPLRIGEIYIMNENGKTVATYNLYHQADAARRYDARVSPQAA